ncbi:hypothetical protein PR048_028775 [Dryococelus australis]|uniref:Uncharacterized protein n=1 Tax=Dryococelus australis TaxID=614101 RepID=A0ABQ9GBH7_9NEOP|nr:hypothetical protein PR048_028775 [Dryococelus australis]
MERRWNAMGRRDCPEKARRQAASYTHNSHMRKSGSGPAGYRARIAVVGGERHSHCATAVATVSLDQWITRVIRPTTMVFESAHFTKNTDNFGKFGSIMNNREMAATRPVDPDSFPSPVFLNSLFCGFPKPLWADAAMRLACSPPIKAIRVQSPGGSLLIFGCGNRGGRCRWSTGFFGDLPFPPPFHSGTAPYPNTLIGSQDLTLNVPNKCRVDLCHCPMLNGGKMIPQAYQTSHQGLQCVRIISGRCMDLYQEDATSTKHPNDTEVSKTFQVNVEDKGEGGLVTARDGVDLGMGNIFCSCDFVTFPGLSLSRAVTEDSKSQWHAPRRLVLTSRRPVPGNNHVARVTVAVPQWDRAARLKSRSKGAIRATLTRTPSASSLLRARLVTVGKHMAKLVKQTSCLGCGGPTEDIQRIRCNHDEPRLRLTPMPYLGFEPRAPTAKKGGLHHGRSARHVEDDNSLVRVNMEQRRNEGEGETGDPRVNPPASGIVRHD